LLDGSYRGGKTVVKKISVAISVLTLIAAAFIFASAINEKKSISTPGPAPPAGETKPETPPDRTSTQNTAGATPAESGSGSGSAIPPGLKPDIPPDKIDGQSARGAYDKATSLAAKTPELNDIKMLIPVMLKFSPSELSTLTRLANRTMSKDEIEQAKSILLSKLNQDEVSLLLQLGPEYGLDFRAVLGVTDKKK